MTAGAGLMVIGGLIGFTGMTLAGTAVAVAARQRMREMDVSPIERASLAWQQARQATLAGARAWQEAAPNARS